MKIIESLFFMLSFTGYLYVAKQKLMLWFAPLAVISMISIILYFAGLAGILSEMALTVLVGGLGCFIYMLLRICRKKIIFHMPRLEIICMCAGCIIFLFLVGRQNFTHYDNFSHWALIVKRLLCTDRLPGITDNLIVFKDYPPGLSVFIYYVCTFLGRGEGVMLMAQTGVILACFWAIFGIVRESRRFLLYSFMGMGCSILSYLNLTIRINNLLVDFILPLMSLAVIAAVYRLSDDLKKATVCTSCFLAFTGIIKSTGLVFAAIAFIFYLWMILRQKKYTFLSRLTMGICTGMCMLLPYILWKIYLNDTFGAMVYKFSMSASSSEYMSADRSLYGQITRDFLKNIFEPSGRAIHIFVLFNFLGLVAVCYARVVIKKSWKLGRILLLANIITIAYYGGILGLYLFSMPESEAVRLAGFDRYSCSIMVLFAGILILGAAADIEKSFAVDIDVRGSYMAYSSPEAKRRYQYAVLAFLVIAVNLLYSEYNGMVSIQSLYETSLPGKVKAIAGDRWYDNGFEDEKKYLIAASDLNRQVSDWSVSYVCKYFLYASDVNVVQRLDEGNIETFINTYDYIMVLETEAVQLPENGKYAMLLSPGIYGTDLLRNNIKK